MENYLREVLERLVALGAERRSAMHGVELTRTWIQTEMLNGTPESRAVELHRQRELPGLLAGARGIERTRQMLSLRTPPPPVLPRERQPDPEQLLSELIQHLRQMEAERILQRIQRDYPGGGIASPEDVAMSGYRAAIIPLGTLMIRITPIVGDVIDLAEAAFGRDLFSGAELSGGDRALRAGFGIAGLITVAGRIVAGLARGTARMTQAIVGMAGRIGTTAGALRASFERFARLSRHVPSIGRAISRLENGVEMAAGEIVILREFFERLLEYVRLGRGVALDALEAGARVLSRVTGRSGALIRVVERGGELQFWRCAGP